MIELARHIEVLLLENDCVIIPGIGGFVTHYTASVRIEEENLFIPPARVIGFNPQLKMNDGLLTQSYMSVYGTNFSDATKMIERKADELITLLHEDGKAELPNIGEICCSIRGDYSFTPYDNKLISPQLYGLDTFEMQELSVLESKQEEKKAIPVSAGIPRNEPSEPFKPRRTYLINTVAAAAAVILFFIFSTPIKNTEVAQGNYAELSPAAFFEQIKSYSLVTSPMVISKQQTLSQTTKQTRKPMGKSNVGPIAVREVKVKQAEASKSSSAVPHVPDASIPAIKTPKEYSKSGTERQSVVSTTSAAVASQPAENITPPSIPIRSYHIIVASVATEQDARQMAAKLVEDGFSDAKAIIGDGKMRVCIQSCGTETEAYQTLTRIRENATYETAWILKK